MGMAGKETAGDSSGGLESAGASGARKPCLESALSFLSPATPMGTAGWATQVGASGGFSWQLEASGGRTIGIFREGQQEEEASSECRLLFSWHF